MKEYIAEVKDFVKAVIEGCMKGTRVFDRFSEDGETFDWEDFKDYLYEGFIMGLSLICSLLVIVLVIFGLPQLVFLSAVIYVIYKLKMALSIK